MFLLFLLTVKLLQHAAAHYAVGKVTLAVMYEIAIFKIKSEAAVSTGSVKGRAKQNRQPVQ